MDLRNKDARSTGISTRFPRLFVSSAHGFSTNQPSRAHPHRAAKPPGATRPTPASRHGTRTYRLGPFPSVSPPATSAGGRPGWRRLGQDRCARPGRAWAQGGTSREEPSLQPGNRSQPPFSLATLGALLEEETSWGFVHGQSGSQGYQKGVQGLGSRWTDLLPRPPAYIPMLRTRQAIMSKMRDSHLHFE